MPEITAILYNKAEYDKLLERYWKRLTGTHLDGGETPVECLERGHLILRL